MTTANTVTALLFLTLIVCTSADVDGSENRQGSSSDKPIAAPESLGSGVKCKNQTIKNVTLIIGLWFTALLGVYTACMQKINNREDAPREKLEILEVAERNMFVLLQFLQLPLTLVCWMSNRLRSIPRKFSRKALVRWFASAYRMTVRKFSIVRLPSAVVTHVSRIQQTSDRPSVSNDGENPGSMQNQSMSVATEVIKEAVVGTETEELDLTRSPEAGERPQDSGLNEVIVAAVRVGDLKSSWFDIQTLQKNWKSHDGKGKAFSNKTFRAVEWTDTNRIAEVVNALEELAGSKEKYVIGGLPLALTHAGSYINWSDSTFLTYTRDRPSDANQEDYASSMRNQSMSVATEVIKGAVVETETEELDLTCTPEAEEIPQYSVMYKLFEAAARAVELIWNRKLQIRCKSCHEKAKLCRRKLLQYSCAILTGSGPRRPLATILMCYSDRFGTPKTPRVLRWESNNYGRFEITESDAAEDISDAKSTDELSRRMKTLEMDLRLREIHLYQKVQQVTPLLNAFVALLIPVVATVVTNVISGYAASLDGWKNDNSQAPVNCLNLYIDSAIDVQVKRAIMTSKDNEGLTSHEDHTYRDKECFSTFMEKFASYATKLEAISCF